MRTPYSIVAMVALAGCASVGQDFSMADVDAMQPGITTFQDAVAKLGKPNSTSMSGDGRTASSWVRVTAGLGGSSNKTVIIVFDKDGKMIRVAQRTDFKTN
jgi:hypothetical protein